MMKIGPRFKRLLIPWKTLSTQTPKHRLRREIPHYEIPILLPEKREAGVEGALNLGGFHRRVHDFLIFLSARTPFA